VTFAFTPEQEAMRRTVRDFAAKEMAPHVDEWEAEAIFPRPLFAKMGELGLAGMLCPEEYGGSNLDRVTVAIVGEEIGRVFRSASFIFVHNMVLSYVVTHGTEEQKQRWAVPMARGEKLGAFALTEPSAGSDAAAITTRAVREGDYYVIDGDKRFISNADSADVISVAAKTDPTQGARGVSIIVVERGTPGYSVPKIEHKMAMHASHACDVVFEGCRVPRANLLAGEGDGFKVLMGALDGGRINVAATAIGGAQGAFDAALRYAKERVQFGRPIAEFQAIQFRDRGGPPAHLLRRGDDGPGTAGDPPGGDGQALRHRHGHARDGRCRASLRRLRLHPGVQGRAVHARGQAGADRRGHEPDPAHYHRPRATEGIACIDG